MRPMILSLLLVLAAGWPGSADPEAPYPQGRRFPLGLYSIHTVEEMQRERAFGWNLAHRYSMKPDFLATVKEGGMYGLVSVTEEEEAAAKTRVGEYLAQGPVGWWTLPEEPRYWRANEFDLMKNLVTWVQAADPNRRPIFVYHAGHYTADALAHYVPHLDIIGAGTYTEYSHQPRGWVRWRMEETIRGIEKAGARIGPDYRQGEKTPIGIPMLFANLEQMDVISPVEGYHDFYSCLAAGAKGILIFSYFHRNNNDVLRKTYEAYAKAAAEVSGPEKLGEALLFGTEVKLGFEITEGPQQTYPFRPFGLPEDFIFPSLNVRALRYENKLYVITVNSSERGLKASLTGLPAGVTKLTAPFERVLGPDKKPTEEVRTVAVQDGVAADSWTWLGVHVYTSPWPVD